MIQVGIIRKAEEADDLTKWFLSSSREKLTALRFCGGRT